MSRKKKRRIRWWAWGRRATALAFLVLLTLGQFDWFPWFRGSAAGTKLLDIVPFADPLAALEVTLATRQIHATLLIGAAILIVGALLLGPVFCGWICPLGFVLDMAQSIREWVMGLLGFRRRKEQIPFAIPPVVRYGMLGVFAGFAIVAQLPLFQLFSPINLIVRSMLFVVGPGLAIVVLILIAEQIWPRLWCRSLCPLGALYSLVGRFGLWRVRIDPSLAGQVPCKQCTIRCPMGIKVMEDYSLAGKSSVDHPLCTRCGDCIDVCPRGVLKLRMRNITGTPSAGVIDQTCPNATPDDDDESRVSLPVLPPEAIEPS